MSTFLARAVLAFVLILCGAIAHAVPPSAISGSYFDPYHSGHGFSIEALEGERAIAWWYVYDRDGNPLHLYIEGTLRPRPGTAALDLKGRAYLPRGMRFGTFDPAELTLAQWGDVELAISCTSAGGRFDANGPAGAGFGNGPLFLWRLSAIKGIVRSEDCGPELPGSYTPSAYTGTYSYAAGSKTAPLIGALDASGRLWLVAPGLGGPVITAFISPILFTRTIEPDVRANVALFGGLPRSAQAKMEIFLVAEADLPWRVRAVHSSIEGYNGAPYAAPDLVNDVDVDVDVADTAALHRPFDLGAIAGRRFINSASGSTVTVDTRGVLCLVRYPNVSMNCALSGKLTPVPGEWAFFDFELAYAEGDIHAPVKGRGWVLSDAEGRAQRLVLVGAQGGDGLGFVGDVVGR